MLGESIKIMLPTATGLVKQISFGGLGRRKCQSIRKTFPYVKGALSSLKKWISRQYLHLVQAENVCLKSALEGKSDVSLIEEITRVAIKKFKLLTANTLPIQSVEKNTKTSPFDLHTAGFWTLKRRYL
jgi:hypothetical protein